ncbi:MAG: amidohydrolase family protein [Desulfomonilaceae bacterium]
MHVKLSKNNGTNHANQTLKLSMKQKECYIGFEPLTDFDQMVEGLLQDHPDDKWRSIRNLCRVAEPEDRHQLASSIEKCFDTVQDLRIRSRLVLAIKALKNPIESSGYVLVKGKGAFKEQELPFEKFGSAKSEKCDHLTHFLPVVDFRINPQIPDMKLFVDMRRAGVSKGVIVATDTDPSDLDRPLIRENLYKQYACCDQSRWLSFDEILPHLRNSLHSITNVTNTDVSTWVMDYPGVLFGLGSVNLSKDRRYVEEKLAQIGKLGLKGVNLLPHAQFFNPAENENIDILFQYCKSSGFIVVSHTGCGMGPFDILELSRNSNPILWTRVLKKFPDVPLVFSHFGSYSEFLPGIWLYETLNLGKNFQNVYAELSGVEWILDRPEIVREIRKTITFDRILFGTDYPLPLMSGMGPVCLVGSVQANRHLSDKEKRKVLGENAIKLLRSN